MKQNLGLGVLISLLICSATAADISFGSSSDLTHLDLEPGDYGVFTASFFNMGEKPLDVEFEIEYPSDLRVEVSPAKLTLGTDLKSIPDSQGEWLILDGGKRYVKTYPVKLYIKIPSTISRNRYTIKLVAKASVSAEAGGGGFKQSLVQVREILFTVDVEGRIQDTGESVTVIRVDPASWDSISYEAEESFKEKSDDTSSSKPASGYTLEPTTSSGGSSSSTDSQETPSSSFGISKDPEGNTNIDLPTGKVTLNQEQTETAIDLGLITLLISIGSLVVRILK